MATPPRSTSGSTFDRSVVQAELRRLGVDGWLLHDFRGSNPVAWDVAGIAPHTHLTRQFFYFIPADGEPALVVNPIEQHHFRGVPGRIRAYHGWRGLREVLSDVLQGARVVAMEYSPENAIPYLSKVDAGTVELVRALGKSVVSSVDLVQRLVGVLDENGWRFHQEAASVLHEAVQAAFAHIGAELAAGRTITEYDVQTFLLDRFRARGMETDAPPVCAVNAMSAVPHYSPTAEDHQIIRRGDFVLIDAWCRKAVPGAIYADITWVASAGDRVPEEPARIFDIVRGARDRAIEFLVGKSRSGQPVRGYEVDQVCRSHVAAAGYERYFFHRTGHSIDHEVHGIGVNLDDFESHDTRLILPGSLFSVEPGIYLPDRFGVRSEVNVYATGDGAIITGGAPQTEIMTLLPG